MWVFSSFSDAALGGGPGTSRTSTSLETSFFRDQLLSYFFSLAGGVPGLRKGNEVEVGEHLVRG